MVSTKLTLEELSDDPMCAYNLNRNGEVRGSHVFIFISQNEWFVYLRCRYCLREIEIKQ